MICLGTSSLLKSKTRRHQLLSPRAPLHPDPRWVCVHALWGTPWSRRPAQPLPQLGSSSESGSCHFKPPPARLPWPALSEVQVHVAPGPIRFS